MGRPAGPVALAIEDVVRVGAGRTAARAAAAVAGGMVEAANDEGSSIGGRFSGDTGRAGGQSAKSGIAVLPTLCGAAGVVATAADLSLLCVVGRPEGGRDGGWRLLAVDGRELGRDWAALDGRDPGREGHGEATGAGWTDSGL